MDKKERRTARGKYFNSYSEADVENAVKKIKTGGISLSEASREFSVPCSTLHGRLTKPAGIVHGKTQILSKETEANLAEWIIECAAYGDPRNRKQILEAAAELAKLNPDEKQFKTDSPSNEWFKGFLKRNPQIACRSPSSISRASALVSKQNIVNFITETKRALQENLGEACYEALVADPTAWGNCDETNFELNPLPQTVFGKKGERSVYIVETAKPKENVSVMFTFLASGEVLTPQLIFKKSMSENKMRDIAHAAGVAGITYALSQTEKGWQTQESFYEYVTVQLVKDLDSKGVTRTREHPFILYFDGHKSHISYGLFRWCKEHNIVPIALFPNATHILQMADVKMFGPGKKSWVKEVQTWKQQTNNRELTEVDFVKILKNVIDRVMLPETIQKGFRETGTYPLAPENARIERCVGADVTACDESEEITQDDLQTAADFPIECSPLSTNVIIISNEQLCGPSVGNVSPSVITTLKEQEFEFPIECPQATIVSNAQLCEPYIENVKENVSPSVFITSKEFQNSLKKLNEVLCETQGMAGKYTDLKFPFEVMKQQLGFINNRVFQQIVVPSPSSSLPLSPLNTSGESSRNILAPVIPFRRVGLHRNYRKMNHGIMTTEEKMEQYKKFDDEKQHQEEAKKQRIIEREERKKQAEIIKNIKKEKTEEKKAERIAKNLANQKKDGPVRKRKRVI